MAKNLRVAQIGAGYWGKNLVRVLSEIGVLSMICDTDKTILAAHKSKLPHVDITTDFDKVLADADVAAVSIATPGPTHYRLVKESLTADKDVFVEKPLSLKIEEGQELADLAAQRKRILMVGHILRYHPAILRIKELIDKGAVGKVGYCYSNRLNLGKVRTAENILWSFAPHDISVLNYLMGGPPDEVHASGEIILQPGIHDVTLTTMKWHNKASAHINVSWLHPFKEHRFVVVGDKAILVFDDTREKDKLEIYNCGIDFVKGEPVKRNDEKQAVPFEAVEPLRVEMDHFVECIRKRTVPKTDALEALAVLQVLTQAQNSLLRNEMPPPAEEKTDYYAHEKAVVDTGARIGKGTKVWHFSHVMPGAVIGERCNLGQNVLVANNVIIGNNVKIQNNVSVYEGVVLEDDCFCGPSMVFTNVKNPRAAIPRNTESDYLKTYIKKGATLGANCTIVCGVTIGENAFVAAGAVVTKDVKPFALMAGVPAKQIGWSCACGYKLSGTGIDRAELQCPECERKFVLTGEDLLPTK